MEFRAECESLAEALNTASRASAGATTSRMALTGLHLSLEGNTLTAVGTDLDRTITTQTEVQGKRDGQALVPAKLICDVVKALPDDAAKVSVSESDATVTSGASEFMLRILDVEDFPQNREIDDLGAPVSISSQELYVALDQVVRAASNDDSRPILTGILVDGATDGSPLLLVSTDSYRLARRAFDGASIGDEQKVLVPAKAAAELLRLLNPKDEDETVEVQLGEHHVLFRVGETTLSTRLIPGDFPNYGGLIPKEDDQPSRVSINREMMLDALNRVRVLAQDSAPVKLKIADDSILLKAQTHDVGQAEETISHEGLEGPGLEIAFNPTYLKEGLEAIYDPVVKLGMSDNVKPVTLTSAKDDTTYLYLLMPVRTA